MNDSLYSFVLVDDEPEIREGIQNVIPWNELGFSFEGACSNGFEALELAERIQLDAVLTDINMPFLDGLAFTDRLTDLSPVTKVLIITGYDDFDYTHKALQLKVYDYILKPVTPSELIEILKKLKNTLDNERTERQNLEYIKRQLAESIPLLRERFLSHLIEGKSDRKTIRERIRYFNLAMPLEGAYLCLVSGFVHRREGENSDIDLLTRRHILEGLLETLPKSGKPAPGIPFQDRDDRLCFLTWGKDAVNLYREGLKIAESICRDMQAARIKDCIIGVGEPVYTLEALPASYNSSVEALVAATLKGKNGVTTYREAVGKTGTATVENLPKWEKNITSALKIDNGEEACRIINEMFSYLQKTHFSFGEYHIEFVLLLTALMRCCDDLEIPKEEIFPSGADSFAMLPMQLPTGISQLKNLGEIKAWFSGLVERISGYIQIRKEKFARSKVREALDYLETNYSDPNLSLRNLCKKLAISMSYFSANLKNYHNKTFVEELTRIRINKAMELLRTTDLMVYEVAEKIGYRDAHYFSLSFHKFTGLTTQEYRNRNAQNRQ